MYGLVNKAVEGLVRDQFGPASWEQILKEAGLDIPCFVSMHSYPDEITYRLIGAASTVLGIPQESILQTFGRHWILFTAEEGYGCMLDLCGSTFREFLLNLPTLHTRIELMFPHLNPPVFVCHAREDGGIDVNYHSNRPGLELMVKGLLEGLGERFKIPLKVEHTQRRADGANHDVFVVHETASAPAISSVASSTRVAPALPCPHAR